MTALWIVLSVCGVLTLTGVGFVNQPKFGKNPSGARLERILNSPHYQDGKFVNETPTEQMTNENGFFGNMWDYLTKEYPNTIPDSIIAIKTDLFKLPLGEDWLVWFGHSSYFMRISGKSILVDPVFYSGAPLKEVNPMFKGTDIYKPKDIPPVDYLVISHDHWDHLDYDVVKEMKDKIGRVICPLGVGEHFEYWGYEPEKIVELDWGEKAELDNGFTVHALPARHFSGRGLRWNKTLWASFMFTTPSLNIYIGGDGGYDDRFKRIAEEFPKIDLAILENGQYNEKWALIHSMPSELPLIAKDLNARQILTVHHSKFKLSNHPFDEPIKNAEALRKDSINVWTPQIGEVLKLDTLSAPTSINESVQNLQEL